MKSLRLFFVAVVALLSLPKMATSASQSKSRESTGWGVCSIDGTYAPGVADVSFAYRVGTSPRESLAKVHRSLDVWSNRKWKELGDVSGGFVSPVGIFPMQIDHLAKGVVDKKSPFGLARSAEAVSALRENSLTLQILRLGNLRPGRYRVRFGDYKDFNVPTVAAEFRVGRGQNQNLLFDQLSAAFLPFGAGGTVATANPTVLGSGGGQLFLPQVQTNSTISFKRYAALDSDAFTPFELALRPTALDTGVRGVLVPALDQGVYQIEITNPEVVASNTPARTTTVALFVNDTCKLSALPVDPID
jgi:hypothetical protein